MMMNARNDNNAPFQARDDGHQARLYHGDPYAMVTGSPPKLVPPVLDPTMMMSDQEWRWAKTLKQALHESERFENTHLSDMEIAQHAIAAQGNVVEAKVRIEGLAQFRDEYGIDHSLEQAMYVVGEFMKQQPGYLLHFDVLEHNQQAMMVSDSAAFSQDAAFEASASHGADENWKICVSAIYYFHWILQPSLAAMRQGIMATVECEGVGWHNFRIEYISRLFEEMFSYLPVKFQCIRAYNTTVVANLLFSLARPFMGQNMKQSVQLGFQIGDDDANGGRRLSEFYLQPSLEAAQLRLYQRIQALMMVRLVNDKQFRL